MSSQEIQYRNYTVEDGLPSSVVYHVIQDSRGYMWFATQSGVSRFDGINFVTFTTENGLPDNDVLEIHEDSKGRIWFLTFAGIPAYFYNDSIYSFKNNPQYKQLDIASHLTFFYEDTSGNIWLGTYANGLIKISGSSISAIHDKKIRKRRVYYIGENTRKDLVLIADTLFYNMTRKEELPGNSFLRMVRNGEIKFNYLKGTIPYPYLGEDISLFYKAFSKEEVIYISKEEQNEYWIGTYGKGAVSFGNLSDTASYISYLHGKTVSSVCKDFEGNLWFSTLNNGVYLLPFNYRHFKTYKHTSSGESVFAVNADKHGNIWVGLNKAIAYVKGDRFIIYPVSSEKEVNRFNHILSHSDGSIWCVGEGKIVVIKNGKIIREFLGGAKAIIQVRDDIYLAGVQGLIIYDKSIKPRFVKFKRMNCLAIDLEGTIFAGTNQGLYQFKNDSLKVISQFPDLLSNKIVDLKVDKDNMLWIATEGSGLIRYSKNSAFEFTVKTGLLSNICKKIVVDDENNVWLATPKGLNKIINRLNSIPLILHYTSADGLPSNEITGICKSRGAVWVATSKGLVTFDEKAVHHRNIPPRIYINHVSIWDKNARTDRKLELAHDENNIKIGFIGLSYMSFGDILYKYKMDGVDKFWVYTNQRNVRYTSLPPGNYTFRVNSMNKDGLWNTAPATFSFVVGKPYWQTWWFSTLSIFFILMGLGGLFYYFLNNIRKKAALKQDAHDSEQKALRAQMNPHFIFNSLNSVQRFILQNDADSAHRFLSKFGMLIRSIMENSSHAFLPLTEEVKHLELYLQMESLRLKNRFDFIIRVDESIDQDNILIPSMIIQPYVENAIWHGIMPLTEKGMIEVDMKPSGSGIYCSIRDNGIGRKRAEEIKRTINVEANSVAMKVTEERLRILSLRERFKSKITVTDIESEKQTGTLVEIIVPSKSNF